ncbi:non-hydrolyzing UDP-N-acetylglucosamine 2-epimerase [Dyadobacter tibetensis]|uniref:non-hydrolyzing UDP-N-acetylglucosamine 2-epimerase n=1 Tax=Dyadobacter tibetensis TaxID=1211851 RepID=UPI0004B0B588|nr:UDP-N-acetylglucosamine 2-epimerase (non-hydrolyzing) [Dyadobacter tibetensis]
MTLKILTVIGARPNFMKVAPLHKAFLQNKHVESRIVHTGQHSDVQMSEVFFDQLDLPSPDHYLGVSGPSHAVQTANIMIAFEGVLLAEKPDVVVVVGDVNSTLACALVAAKEQIAVVHVEAGLRSGDRKMPEEINRILTDRVAEHLFVSETSAIANLTVEGISKDKIHFVGNVMIDTLMHYQEQALKLNLIDQYDLKSKGYIFCTMHRPGNVDIYKSLLLLIEVIKTALRHRPVIFSIHPRTRGNLNRFGLLEVLESLPDLVILEPQGYLQCLNLMYHAAAVITDSGGIQEETTYLKIPCITFRSNTERPATILLGTNHLLEDLDPHSLDFLLGEILSGKVKQGGIPPLWDGKAAGRIAAILVEHYHKD